MNAGQLLKVVRDLINQLEADGILKDDGSFLWPTSIQPDVHLAAQIETILKAHGVLVPADVDKVMAALPLVLSIAGVK